MDLASFWNLIDQTRREANGDPEHQVELLRERLSELESDEVVAFDRHFVQCHEQAYTWDLWGAAFVLGGGCSDDGFMDFRAWLISRGKRVYETALEDADSLVWAVKASDGECQLEEIQYVAAEAWEQITSLPADEFPEPVIERKAEPDGQPSEEDELAERLPNLSRKFG